LFSVAALSGLVSCGESADSGEWEAWVAPDAAVLGERPAGKILRGRIRIRNPHRQSFKILQVQGSCVCQDIRLLQGTESRRVSGKLGSPMVVAGGESVALEFRVRAGLGPFDLSFAIHTDDPDFPMFTAQARYVGVPAFVLSGGDVDTSGVLTLPALTVGESREFRIQVRRRDQQPFRLLSITEGLPQGVELHLMAAADHRQWSLEGRVGPATEAMSSMGGRITIHTDGEDPLSLSVVAPVRKWIERSPDRLLSYGVVMKEQGKVRSWRLRLAHSGSLAPQAVRTEGRTGVSHVLDCKWELMEQGRVLVIRARVLPGESRGKFGGRLVVEFSNQEARSARQDIRYAGFMM